MKTRLNKITVKSFVTNIDEKPSKKVMGGVVRTKNLQECLDWSDIPTWCCVMTQPPICP